MRQGQSRPVTAVFPPGRQLVVAMGQSGRVDAPWSSTGLCRWPRALPKTELLVESLSSTTHPHWWPWLLGTCVYAFVKWLSDSVQVFEV